jgi:hypothetical protein
MKAYARVSGLSRLKLKDPCMNATMGTTFVSASQRNGSQEAWDFKVFCGYSTLELHTTRSKFSEGEL